MKTTLSASATADAISLEVHYVGHSVKYGTTIPKSAILVKAIYADNTKKDIFNWEYLGSNIVTANNTILKIHYQSCTASVKIPLIYKKTISFECHYHGEPVPIGTEFDPKKLHARILLGDGTWKELHSYDYEISSKLVTEVGNNIYTATYSPRLKDDFTVLGYNVDNLDKDFKIFQRNGNIDIDVTDAYYPLFYNDLLGKIHVTKLNSELTAGEYTIILPKNTGLNCKHASEWKVFKELNNNIKITPIKFYHKEDYENG